jgi:hypothetical protein
MTTLRADAAGSIDIEAGLGKVYGLITDLDTLAGLSGEFVKHHWIGRARSAVPGARFIGVNRRGWRRWFTVCRVTEADLGGRFAFDVAFGPLPVARWQYDLAPTEAGCQVTESMWDRRPAWVRPVLARVVGPRDRLRQNQTNIAATLRRLKQRAEAAS